MKNKVFMPHSKNIKGEVENFHTFIWLHFATIIIFTLIAHTASAEDYVTKLRPLSSKTQSRTPANFVPNDDFEVTPIQQHVWYEDILVEDDRGVLKDVKKNMGEWRDREEYVRSWYLESTGVYEVPTIDERKKYLGSNLLKYLDKRLAGEIRRAEDGSTLKKIGEVQKALRPQTEAKLSSKVKIKFKARVLQGRGYIFVDNPYVDHVTEVTAGGSIYMKTQKVFKQSKVTTRIDYDVKSHQWIASAERPVAPHVTARISSAQSDDKMAFTKSANNIVELRYGKSF